MMPDELENITQNDAEEETEITTEETPETQEGETQEIEDKTISIQKFKELAKEYGLDGEDFAKLDDPDEIAKRTMQQMKGYRGYYERMRDVPATPRYHTTPAAPGTISPNVEETANRFLEDPDGFIQMRVNATIAQREMMNANAAIDSYLSTVDPGELQTCAPLIANDPVVQYKQRTGQIITVDDIKHAHANAKELVASNVAHIHDQGYQAGLSAADQRKRAAVVTTTKSSGKKSKVLTVAELEAKYGKGNIPEELIDAAIAAYE